MRRYLLLAVAVAGFSATNGVAVSIQAQGIIMPRPCPPCPPDADCRCIPDSAPIVRTASDVRAELLNGVVRYEVTETFVNRGGGLGEADYLFPLPAGAAFQELQLSINGELVSGETMNADRARSIYEEIVRRQRDPALVEWMGHGLLRARIFPINPGESKKVVVRYQAVAVREGDALRVDYFRGTAPNNGIVNVRRETRETTSFSLTYPDDRQYGTAYSPTHDVQITRVNGRRRVMLRGDARDVTVLLPMHRGTEAAITVLPYATGTGDGFAMISLAPPRMAGATTTPRDVTVVIDVSGSMSGAKLKQAKAAVQQLLETLQEDDRFRVIDFSTDVRTFRDDFALASRGNIASARRYVNQLDANGSTNIAGALDEALRIPETRGRLPLVLFITDGEPTVGERDPAAIASQAAHDRGRARVFTFGLGADVNVSLLEQLALQGRGTAQFVRPDESVERSLSLVADRLATPLVTDVRIESNGVQLRKILPMGPSDIFAGQDLVVFGRYTGDGNATITFTGQTPRGPVRWTTRVNFPSRDRTNAFVARLWATQRIGYLDAEKRAHGGSAEVDDEIRALGEEFGIPTEFSSYLVQEPTRDVANMSPRDRRLRGVRGTAGANAATAVSAQQAPPAAPQAREAQFEVAKAAAAQRSVVSLAAADSLAGATMASNDETGSHTRRIGTRLLTLDHRLWTDGRPIDKLKIVTVTPFSDAYFALANTIPELRDLFTVGDHLQLVGRAIVIRVAANGVDHLSPRELDAVRTQW